MTSRKAHKKTAPKQAPLFGQKPEEHREPARFDMDLSPIIDKKSYDRFIKTISLRIYTEFEKTLSDAGIEKPELSLVGFDLKKAAAGPDVRMAEYVAVNARLIVDRAFVDPDDFVSKYMPRVTRQTAIQGDMMTHMEGKVQHDIMMEIRAIAMQHIPESDRYSFRHKLKVL